MSAQLFSKNFLEKIEKIDSKMPPKRSARHRGDDDSADVREKNSRTIPTYQFV